MNLHRPRRLASFTLIELMTVMLIIGILAALTLAAFSGVMNTAARSRTRTEIGQITTGLESYKIDNGAYPSVVGGFPDTNYATDNALSSTPGGLYQGSSASLYQALTGQTNYETPVLAGTKIYVTFKTSQLGNITAGNNTFMQDPFGNSYGYFSGAATSSPITGANQFDIWSTGGDVATPAATNSWISNWGLGE